MKRVTWILCLLLSLQTLAQKTNHSEQVARTAMARWPDSTAMLPAATIDASSRALLLQGIEAVWSATGKGIYYEYIRNTIDQYVQPDGSFKTADESYVSLGPSILMLYQVSKKDRYRKAADQLYRLVETSPKTGTAKTNQQQFETARFYAAYNSLFHKDSTGADLLKTATSLSSKKGVFENTAAPGLMLLDALDKIPATSAAHKELVTLFQRYATQVKAMRDSSTNTWTSGGKAAVGVDEQVSLLVIATLLNGSRMGYTDDSFNRSALAGYKTIIGQYKSSAKKGAKGGNATLGDNARTAASMMLAAREAELEGSTQLARGKKVLLDYYYNNEREKDATGREVRFHYTWEDRANSGYYVLGQVFRSHGATLAKLETSAASLKQQDAGIYIIVDPDTEKESARPHFLEAADIKYITDWVGEGGVLVLLGNDKGNAEFTHFNQLASKLGIVFNEDKQNGVINDQFEQGVVMTPPGSEVFGDEKKLYIKEFSSLELRSPAEPILTKGALSVMAVSPYGKGYVIALGDPWIYNEYVDGRKLPAGFQNYEATVEWTKWLLGKTKK